jgi:hypothetical protein
VRRTSHHLILVINLDNDEAGPSKKPHGRRDDAGQGCSSYLPQPKEVEPDDDEDYMAAMYHRLGLGRDGNGSGSY